MGVVSGVMVRHWTNTGTETGKGSGLGWRTRNVKVSNSEKYNNWETIFSCLYSQRIWNQSSRVCGCEDKFNNDANLL